MRSAWNSLSYSGESGAARYVRPHVTPGPISTSWELFLPELGPGEIDKYEILGRETRELRLKADPYAARYENRPATASITVPAPSFQWDDTEWLDRRGQRDWLTEPISIYEVHLGSWRRSASGQFLNYREVASQLADYAKDLGFTHVELLPITEQLFGRFCRCTCSMVATWLPQPGPPDTAGFSRSFLGIR